MKLAQSISALALSGTMACTSPTDVLPLGSGESIQCAGVELEKLGKEDRLKLSCDEIAERALAVQRHLQDAAEKLMDLPGKQCIQFDWHLGQSGVARKSRLDSTDLNGRDRRFSFEFLPRGNNALKIREWEYGRIDCKNDDSQIVIAVDTLDHAQCPTPTEATLWTNRVD